MKIWVKRIKQGIRKLKRLNKHAIKMIKRKSQFIASARDTDIYSEYVDLNDYLQELDIDVEFDSGLLHQYHSSFAPNQSSSNITVPESVVFDCKEQLDRLKRREHELKSMREECILELEDKRRSYRDSGQYNAVIERNIAEAETYLNETIVAEIHSIEAKIVENGSRIASLCDTRKSFCCPSDNFHAVTVE